MIRVRPLLLVAGCLLACPAVARAGMPSPTVVLSAAIPQARWRLLDASGMEYVYLGGAVSALDGVRTLTRCTSSATKGCWNDPARPAKYLRSPLSPGWRCSAVATMPFSRPRMGIDFSMHNRSWP